MPSPFPGMDPYLESPEIWPEVHSRLKVLTTQTHLVEIDLLRGQTPMPLGTQTKTDYRILVSRSDTRPKAELYSFDIQIPIPTFGLPLKQGDSEPEIRFKTILDDIYDRAGYGFRIDYQQSPKPSLNKENQQWAMALLKT